MLGRSLRSRLIVAFAATIFLTLTLVTIGFLFILRQYQEQRELIRLGALTAPVSFQVRALEQQGASAAEIVDVLARVADELDVRIVLANPAGLIFHDTEGSLVGQRIDLSAAQRIGALPRARMMVIDGQRGRRIFIAGAPSNQGSSISERFLGRQSAYVVALVSDPLTIGSVLGEMAPRLGVAALVSLVASIGAAWLLAASIARPLARMTRAAEEVARGQYDQQIPTGGVDEVGRLATAFDAMTREVARSHRTLRDFVANVSHDLRTPLTSIQGFSQAMVEGAIRDPEDYAEAGRIINQEAERMRRLVDDLLELSAIESGSASMDLAEVDLGALVRSAGERAKRQADERGLTVTLRLDAAPVIVADVRRLERVFDNILGNAIKHTPPGGQITVAVARGRTVIGGPTVRVSVHNVGSVIPPEDLPRIFERFYQVDKSRAGSAEGNGLGLAIAQEIVQAHGGRVSASSSHDFGTEFVVTLPVLDSPAKAGVASLPDSRPLARRQSGASGAIQPSGYSRATEDPNSTPGHPLPNGSPRLGEASTVSEAPPAARVAADQRPT